MKKIVLAFLATLCLAGVAIAAVGQLDGKTFNGQIIEKGKMTGDPDTFIFNSGTLHSTACDAYGYGPGNYTATKSGELLKFTAETKNNKGDVMSWQGTVTGNKLVGTAITTSLDGKKINYSFNGTLEN